jgi:hypothetical protein
MSERKPLQRTIRGGRAFFFQDPATDKVLNMVVTLAGEVWTLRERLAAMEAIGVRQGSLSPTEVDEFEFTAEHEARLANDRKEFIENLFRVLQEQAETAARRKPAVAPAKMVARAKKKRTGKRQRATAGRSSKP